MLYQFLYIDIENIRIVALLLQQFFILDNF